MFENFKLLLQMILSFAMSIHDCVCSGINFVNVFPRLFMFKLLILPYTCMPSCFVSVVSKYSDLWCLCRHLDCKEQGEKTIDGATMSITIPSDSYKMAPLLGSMMYPTN